MNNAKVFRDLAKPMAAQHLSPDVEACKREDFANGEIPFHHGEFHSNEGAVCTNVLLACSRFNKVFCANPRSFLDHS